MTLSTQPKSRLVGWFSPKLQSSQSLCMIFLFFFMPSNSKASRHLSLFLFFFHMLLLLPSVKLFFLHLFFFSSSYQELLAAVDARPWKSLAKRRVQHYGYEFLYKVNAADSEPSILLTTHSYCYIFLFQVNRLLDMQRRSRCQAKRKKKTHLSAKPFMPISLVYA